MSMMLVSIICCDSDGAAAVETLRAELAQAKEQARRSDAAAIKAVEELRAEQAVHCQSKEKIAKMVVELKDAADRYELLERESQTKTTDLEKAMVATKETHSHYKKKETSVTFWAERNFFLSYL